MKHPAVRAIPIIILILYLTPFYAPSPLTERGLRGEVAWATPRDCPEEKIKTFFDAGAGRDVEAMWSAFSPRQRHFESKARFLEWISEAYRREDAALGERPRVRMTELKVKLIDSSDQLCSYAVYAVQETLTSRARITDILEFLFYLDEKGIVLIEQRGRISTVEERGRKT